MRAHTGKPQRRSWGQYVRWSMVHLGGTWGLTKLPTSQCLEEQMREFLTVAVRQASRKVSVTCVGGNVSLFDANFTAGWRKEQGSLLFLGWKEL